MHSIDNRGSNIPPFLPPSYPNSSRIPGEIEPLGFILPTPTFPPVLSNATAIPAGDSSFTRGLSDRHVVDQSQKKRRPKPKEKPKSVSWDCLRHGGDGEITHTLPDGVCEPTETLHEALEKNGYRISNKTRGSSKRKTQNNTITKELQKLIREGEKNKEKTEDQFEYIFADLNKPGVPLEVNIDFSILGKSILGKRRREDDNLSSYKQSIKYRKTNALKKISIYKKKLKPLQEITYSERTSNQKRKHSTLTENIRYGYKTIKKFKVEIQRNKNKKQEHTINKLNWIVSNLQFSLKFSPLISVVINH